jgi:hypothetical protein
MARPSMRDPVELERAEASAVERGGLVRVVAERYDAHLRAIGVRGEDGLPREPGEG